MYRRPKFLELLLEIRREMAHEADYDTDLFVGRVRGGNSSMSGKVRVKAGSAAEQTATKKTVAAELTQTRKVKKG